MEHIHPDFWKIAALLAAIFLGFPALIVYLLRSSAFFRIWKKLQSLYPLTAELRRKEQPRWIGIPLIYFGDTSLRWMLSECTREKHFFLRPSIILRIVGLRALAIPHRAIARQAHSDFRRIRLPKGKGVRFRYGSLF